MTVRFGLNVQVPAGGAFALLGLQRQLENYENDWARELVRQARIYPPERPGQHYRRTFRFRRGWRIIPARFIGGDLTVRVENATPYAREVVADDFGRGQSGYHIGRWYIFRQLAESREFARGAQAIVTSNIRSARFTSTVRP